MTIETITGAECWMCGESNKDAVDCQSERGRIQICNQCIENMILVISQDMINQEYENT